jgi:hypothetical protein
MFWAAVFASTARTVSLVLVTVMMILIGGWAVSRVRAARRYVDSAADRERWASIAPVLDRHRCGMGVGCGRGGNVGALRGLLANPPIPRSHYRITLSPSGKVIEGTSLLHYENDYDFVRTRFVSPRVVVDTARIVRLHSQGALHTRDRERVGVLAELCPQNPSEWRVSPRCN